MEFLTPQTRIEKAMAPAVKPSCELLDKAAREESPEETAKFYAGRARGDKILEKLNNPHHLDMVKIAHIYLITAAAWKKFESFKSGGEAIRWLRSQKVIGDNVSEREVYQVFQRIKLPLSKPGRPQTAKT